MNTIDTIIKKRKEEIKILENRITNEKQMLGEKLDELEYFEELRVRLNE